MTPMTHTTAPTMPTPQLMPQEHRDTVLRAVEVQLHENMGSRLTPALVIGLMTYLQRLVPAEPPALPEPPAAATPEVAVATPEVAAPAESGQADPAPTAGGLLEAMFKLPDGVAVKEAGAAD